MSDANVRDQLIDDWRNVLATPSGRRLMKHILLDLSGLYRTTFSTNALSMAQAEGRRGMGLTIQSEILSANPNVYAEILGIAAKEATHG